MIKKGFTMAEVLVTLGIIGVVATLTLPALNVSMQQHQAGPSLAKAVNTLANANKLAMAEYDTMRLSDIGNYSDLLKKYVSGHTDTSGSYISDDGIVFNDVSSSSYPLEISIDVNGSKNPNTSAKDVFYCIISENGAVIPYGGLAYRDFKGESGDPMWKTGCNGDSVSNPKTCAGSIADNGWSVRYDFKRVGTSNSTNTSGGTFRPISTCDDNGNCIFYPPPAPTSSGSPVYNG